MEKIAIQLCANIAQKYLKDIMNAQSQIQRLQAAYELLLQVEDSCPASAIADADLQAAVKTVVERMARQALMEQLMINTEGGKIAVIRHNSVDCDGVSMADNAVVIPADVDSYLQHCEKISRNADGYYQLSMCPPSLACAF